MNNSEPGRGAIVRHRALWTALCAGYVALILGTLTLARSLSRWGNRTFGSGKLLLGVDGVYGLLLIAVLVEFRRSQVAWRGLGGALGIAAVAGAVLMTIELPEERIHFIEYIVLAAVAWKMCRAWDASRPLLTAFLISAALGAVDESVQKFLPQRVFDWRDIGFNTVGSLIGTGLLAIRLRWGQPPARTRRTADSEVSSSRNRAGAPG